MTYFFVHFIKREPCTNFCGVLISFHEFMKLQSFEFGVTDVIPANVQNISLLVFLAQFTEKEPITNFYGVFDHFSQMC